VRAVCSRRPVGNGRATHREARRLESADGLGYACTLASREPGKEAQLLKAQGYQCLGQAEYRRGQVSAAIAN
jgi:hypothetical protein